MWMKKKSVSKEEKEDKKTRGCVNTTIPLWGDTNHGSLLAKKT
jgi:hypothetical protein